MAVLALPKCKYPVGLGAKRVTTITLIYFIIMVLILVFFTFLFASGQELSPEEEIVRDAVQIVKDFKNIPEKSIPSSLVKEAYGMAIVPGYVKVGFVVGGSYGRGVMLIREDRRWSYPVFIKMGGGSLGWQIGAQSVDLILIFRTRRSVEGFLKGRFTLGADVSVAAGPVGRAAKAGTDPALDAEVYSYSRTKGLYAGISLEGTVLSIDREANRKYYGGDYSPKDIKEGRVLIIPKSAFELVDLLNTF